MCLAMFVLGTSTCLLVLVCSRGLDTAAPFKTHNYPQSQSRASKSGSSSSTLASKGGREISGSLSQVQRTLSSLSLPGKDLGQCPKRTAKLALRALKLSA